MATSFEQMRKAGKQRLAEKTSKSEAELEEQMQKKAMVAEMKKKIAEKANLAKDNEEEKKNMLFTFKNWLGED